MENNTSNINLFKLLYDIETLEEMIKEECSKGVTNG